MPQWRQRATPSRQSLRLWGVRPDALRGLARAVEPAPGDFGASKGDRFGQAKERETGSVLRAADVIDADPATGTKQPG